MSGATCTDSRGSACGVHALQNVAVAESRWRVRAHRSDAAELCAGAVWIFSLIVNEASFVVTMPVPREGPYSMIMCVCWLE